MPLKIIDGDLLKMPLNQNDYIVHQCNCVTTYPAGLAKDIFDKYPDADIYRDGSRRQPGNIIVRGHVINLLGQFYPGNSEQGLYAEGARLKWFSSALNKIEKLTIENIYFPYKIGCGLAGGDWSAYYSIMSRWARHLPFNVFIVKPSSNI